MSSPWKSLVNTLDLILFVVFVAGLIFLFEGDPDVWDVLHAAAMHGCK